MVSLKISFSSVLNSRSRSIVSRRNFSLILFKSLDNPQHSFNGATSSSCTMSAAAVLMSLQEPRLFLTAASVSQTLPAIELRAGAWKLRDLVVFFATLSWLIIFSGTFVPPEVSKFYVLVEGIKKLFLPTNRPSSCHSNNFQRNSSFKDPRKNIENNFDAKSSNSSNLHF